MTRPSQNPLEGVDRLLIDGSNLLGALERMPDGPMPAAALVGRLRAAIPPSVSIELVFDGPPDPGMRGQRVASGLLVRHSGGRTADAVLLSLVQEARAAAGPRGADNILVVTDDRELRAALTVRGARTARSSWLLGRLARRTAASPTTGNRRSPRPPDAYDGADEREGWRPGRGATTKRGNPKRSRKAPPGA